MSDALLDAWWKRIEPYKIEALRKGFDEYLNWAEYYPVPGTLLPLVEKRFGAKERR